VEGGAVIDVEALGVFGPYITSLIQRSPAHSCSKRRRSLLVGSSGCFFMSSRRASTRCTVDSGASLRQSRRRRAWCGPP
jgi:hypothetical protein